MGGIGKDRIYAVVYSGQVPPENAFAAANIENLPLLVMRTECANERIGDFAPILICNPRLLPVG
jgi:hypothetical protein